MFFEKSAIQDFGPAQITLGFFYANGIGVDKDYKESIKWYRKAAQKGDIFSLKSLAVMFGKGMGCKQSHFMAHLYFGVAGEFGDEEALGASAMAYSELTASELKKKEKLNSKKLTSLLFPKE